MQNPGFTETLYCDGRLYVKYIQIHMDGQNPRILEWILCDCEWMWECLDECEHIPTSGHVNVYVSDYEYMDVSITDLICYHIQVNVWAVIMSEQVWEHVCASQCDLVHVYNHMCENEHGSLFKYEFVCWSKWNFSYGWVNVWPWAWILAYSCMWDEWMFLIMWKWSIFLWVNVQVCAYEYTWIPLRV